MDSLFFLRPLLALIFVCSLIGLAALVAKKLRLEERFTSRVNKDNKKQLGILETQVVDARHKLVLVKRGNTSHLLLLGQHSTTVVETNIPLQHDVIPLPERKVEGVYANKAV